MGNLRSVAKALEHVSPKSRVGSPAIPPTIRAAERVVFPGQGAMPDCMRYLAEQRPDRGGRSRQPRPSRCSGSASASRCCSSAARRATPPDLALLPATVVRFDPQPMMQRGWPESAAHGLEPRAPVRRRIRCGTGSSHDDYFYFVHSYYVVPDATRRWKAARTRYGPAFTCAVAQANIFATQFHPEKSAASGLRALREFHPLAALNGAADRH